MRRGREGEEEHRKEKGLLFVVLLLHWFDLLWIFVDLLYTTNPQQIEPLESAEHYRYRLLLKDDDSDDAKVKQ